LILGISLCGTALTTVAALYLLESSDLEAEARFSLAADRVAQSLGNRMGQYEQGLRSGAALVAAVERVDRASFGRFVTGLNIRERFPGIQAMGFAAWVPAEQREAHVRAVRQDDLPSYDIRPEGSREAYLPILFNEPYVGRNRAVVGFDMMSEPTRRAAITRAARLDEPSISGMVVLAGEAAADRPPGFVFYVPAYDSAGQLKGMLFAPFRVKDLLEAVMAEAAPPGLSIELKDGADMLYASPNRGSLYEISKEIMIAGRQWRVTLHGDDRFLSAADRQRAWIIIGAGATITLALIGMLIALVRSKIAESRFRLFANLGSDWVWEQGADQRFTYFNDPQGLYRGAAPSVVGMSRTELFEQIGAPEEKEHLKDLLARMHNQEPIRDFEYSSRTGDGDRAVVRLSADPKFDLSGRFDGYAGISKDVTRETVREAALIEAKRSADLANLAKSTFLATMSHELRTPLNAIIGFAELIERQHFGPDQTARYVDYAHDIRESGEHLLALVNDILDLAKIESGKLALTLGPVAVAATAAQCAVTLGDQITRKKLRLAVSIPEHAVALADARALRQILLNLLSNAVKFTPEGGRIEVAAARDGDALSIAVSDTGVGLSEQALGQIFTPFYQVDHEIAVRQTGTGLGLTISKLLTEAMGGTIALASEQGEGVTVTLTLKATEPTP
jgi:signal transduction histidine kinase